MYDNKICIKLHSLCVGGLLKDDYSAFACPADAVVYGGEGEHYFALLFKRVYEGGYDLIAAADVDTNKFYFENFDKNDELLTEFINCARDVENYPRYGEFNDIELITPCGSMGTVIDVKIVESASEKAEFYLEGVQYISDGEWCTVCDSSGKGFNICNRGGSYDVWERGLHGKKVEATAEIKAKVRLV